MMNIIPKSDKFLVEGSNLTKNIPKSYSLYFSIEPSIVGKSTYMALH